MKKKTSFTYKEVEDIAYKLLDDYYDDQKIWYKNFQIADKNDVFYNISAPSTWFFHKDWVSWNNNFKIMALCCYIIDFCKSKGWKVTGETKQFKNAVK